MKVLMFWFFAILILILLLFTDTGKEGNLPIASYSFTLGIIIFLTFLDRYRHPEIYIKDESKF